MPGRSILQRPWHATGPCRRWSECDAVGAGCLACVQGCVEHMAAESGDEWNSSRADARWVPVRTSVVGLQQRAKRNRLWPLRPWNFHFAAYATRAAFARTASAMPGRSILQRPWRETRPWRRWSECYGFALDFVFVCSMSVQMISALALRHMLEPEVLMGMSLPTASRPTLSASTQHFRSAKHRQLALRQSDVPCECVEGDYFRVSSLFGVA
jgi:hypothetical protein